MTEQISILDRLRHKDLQGTPPEYHHEVVGRSADIMEQLTKALLAMCREVDVYGLDCADQVQAAVAKAQESTNETTTE